MAPGHLYFLCMALIVMPLLPFSRTAVVVGLVFGIGQVGFEWFQAIAGLHGVEAIHLIGYGPPVPVQPLFEMSIAIMGFGAALGVAEDDVGRAVGMLYLPTAAIQAAAGLGHTDPYSAWWLDYVFALARIAIVPFTADWGAIGRFLSAADAWSQNFVSRGRRLDQW